MKATIKDVVPAGVEYDIKEAGGSLVYELCFRFYCFDFFKKRLVIPDNIGNLETVFHLVSDLQKKYGSLQQSSYSLVLKEELLVCSLSLGKKFVYYFHQSEWEEIENLLVKSGLYVYHASEYIKKVFQLEESFFSLIKEDGHAELLVESWGIDELITALTIIHLPYPGR